MADPSIAPYYQRLQQNPDDAEALFMIWQWHGDRGEFSQLATVVEQTASRRSDPHSAADLYYRSAELWAKNVGRVDRAITDYRRAFELDPGQIQAIVAARNLSIQIQDHALTLALLQTQIDGTTDPIAKIALLREKSEQCVRLGDLSGQCESLEGLLVFAPNDFEAMRELAGALLARSESPVGSEQDRVRAALLLTTIAQNAGGSHSLTFAEAALDAWAGDETAYQIVHHYYLEQGRSADLVLRQIHFLATNPNSSLASSVRRELGTMYVQAEQYDDAIEALAPLSGTDEEVTKLLADLYRQLGRHSEQLAMLAMLPVGDDFHERIAEYRALAEVAGQQQDRAVVNAALLEILRLDPTDPEALAVIEDDLRSKNQLHELRELRLNAVRSGNANDQDRIEWLREVARLSAKELNDPQGALDAWRSLWTIDPHDEEATQAIEEALVQNEQWDDLAHLLEKRATNTDDPTEAQSLWGRLADLQRLQRKDTKGEVEALTKWWSLDPENDELVHRLVAARRRLGDVQGVTEVLRVRAESSSDDLAPTRWEELAAHQEHNGDREGALRSWRRVLDLRTDSVHAWEGLERLLERTGRLDMLLDTLIAHASGPVAGDRPGPIHAKAADVARILGDIPVATAQAEMAVAYSPDDEVTASLLAELYAATNDYAALAQHYQFRAERLPEGEARINYMRLSAQSLMKSAPELAQASWETVRELSKKVLKRDDVEAIQALCDIARVQNRFDSLAELLSEALAVIETANPSDFAAKRELIINRAMLLGNQLQQPAQALDELMKFVRSAPQADREVWRHITNFSYHCGNFTLCASALEEQISRATDDEDKAKLASQLAGVCENQLKDHARAFAARELQHQADPTDYSLVTALATHCEQTSQWEKLVYYLTILSEIEGDDDELALQLQKIANIYEQHLHQPNKAFETLVPLADNGNSQAITALRALADRTGLHTNFVQVLLKQTEKTGDLKARAELWQEVAKRAEKHLKDPELALDARLKAILAKPQDVSELEAIERLATGLDRAEITAQAYNAVIGTITHPTQLRQIALRGIGFLEQASAFDAALDLALAAQTRLPAEDALLEAIVQLAPKAHRGDEMFVAFDRRRGVSRDEKERQHWLVKGAQAAALQLQDRPTALTYLRLAVATAMAHAGKGNDDDWFLSIESAVRPIQEARPELALLSGLSDLYAQIADEQSEDDLQTTSLLLRRAAALQVEVGDGNKAFSMLSRAVSLNSSDVDSMTRLEEIALGLGRIEEVAEFYRRMVDDTIDANIARRFLSRRARLLSEVLGRVDEAVDAMRGLVELSPRDLQAVRGLQQLLEQHERYQDLLLALERELELGQSPRGEVLKRIAYVWEDNLRNYFEARDAWRRVTETDPHDQEAQQALLRLEGRRGTSAPVQTNRGRPQKSPYKEPIEPVSLDSIEIVPVSDSSIPSPVVPAPERSPQKQEPAKVSIAGPQQPPMSARPNSVVVEPKGQGIPSLPLTTTQPTATKPTAQPPLPSLIPQPSDELEAEPLDDVPFSERSGRFQLTEDSAQAIEALPDDQGPPTLLGIQLPFAQREDEPTGQTPAGIQPSEALEPIEPIEPMEALEPLEELEELDALDAEDIEEPSSNPRGLTASDTNPNEPEELDANALEDADDPASLDDLARITVPPLKTFVTGVPAPQTGLPPRPKNQGSR